MIFEYPSKWPVQAFRFVNELCKVHVFLADCVHDDEMRCFFSQDTSTYCAHCVALDILWTYRSPAAVPFPPRTCDFASVPSQFRYARSSSR